MSAVYVRVAGGDVRVLDIAHTVGLGIRSLDGLEGLTLRLTPEQAQQISRALDAAASAAARHAVAPVHDPEPEAA